MELKKLLSEEVIETYFVQVVIKMKDDFNFTEIYNRVRGVKDVVVVKVVDNERLDAVSTDDYKFSLLEMKFISNKDAISTLQDIKQEALSIQGLVKFLVRTNTLMKIRNY